MVEKYEEYYLLMRHLNLSLNDINLMFVFERKYYVKQLKKELKKK